MQGQQKWTQKSVILTQKQSHSENLLGLKKYSQATFLTSSEDKTIRLWDIRVMGSVRLFRHPLLTPQLSNPTTDSQSSIYIASQRTMHMFDSRMQTIFVEDITHSSQHAHYDNINYIEYSDKFRELVACDDEGDSIVYNHTLQRLYRLDQQHSNITNCVRYLYPESQPERRLCVSGGFDSTMVFWDVKEETAIKSISLGELMAKHEISLQNYPFIHHLFCYKNWILATEENGHIICFSFSDLRKPKFILPASLTRVTNCTIAQFGRPLLLTASIDNTFSIFDFIQRKNSQPIFLQKYSTPAQPIAMQALNHTILLAMNSPKLAIYEIKS